MLAQNEAALVEMEGLNATLVHREATLATAKDESEAAREEALAAKTEAERAREEAVAAQVEAENAKDARRGCEPRQEFLPGQYEPRAAHAPFGRHRL